MARVTLRFEACEPGQASLFPSSPLMMPAIFEPAAAWSLKYVSPRGHSAA